MVVELTEAAGRSRQDLCDAAGYDSAKTIDRLARGEGSLAFALAAKRVLRSWGADVSRLPTLDEDGDQGDERVREWVELGKRLRQLANDDRFDAELARVQKVIEAHELVAEGTGKHKPRR